MAPGALRSKRKVTRGGGKNFSKNLRPLDNDGEIPEGMWGDLKAAADGSDDDDSEESSEDDTSKQELTREERRAAIKAKKDAAKARAAAAAAKSDSEDEEEEEEEAADKPISRPKTETGKGGIAITNPNAAGSSVEGALSRREREALDAAAAKEKYWKLQEAGKTDQAKADLARLALIRAERDEKARQRKAEMEDRKAASDAKSAGRKK